ncbi:MAG: beta-galactosidase [Acidobacteria bacterium]|nr:beta-galactosidase [Acidobacteriota bacterium]
MRRRTFLSMIPGSAALRAFPQGQRIPWYRRALRWGQTNITEKDPVRYDIAWWRDYWKRTCVQGVIINAGGIVAYYPSRYPLHYRPAWLGDRDLFGELCSAAHADGLVVLARMDSNRASETFYRAHPDWFARDADDSPYRAGDLFVACINSPYYEEYLPSILREIIERSRPEGITDNSWSGLGRETICYCDNCERKFRERSGKPVPKKPDWDDPVYRQWIRWNYDRRLEIWDQNNRVTQAAGGPHCLWVGMNSGSVLGQSRSFRDMKEICRRAQIIMLDHQRRGDTDSFQENGHAGRLIHGLLGWDKLILESMSMYLSATHSFRLAAKPAVEARMWMVAGFAGGIQPWWHHVGAYHEDRRAYHTAEPLMRWHEINEQYLVGRTPVAAVGVVWSQENVDFYGRDDPSVLVDMCYQGMVRALLRTRIPYIAVHADHIERDAPGLTLLVLPNVAAMSEAQCESVRRFVARGGSLLATGVTSLYDEQGRRRSDFALADLFRTSAAASRFGRADSSERRWARETYHTYLRLTPELRATVPGPRTGNEVLVQGQRHAVLNGFGETDILPYGGMLEPLDVDSGTLVPLTFIPPFPIYPPETSWMREERTSVPALVLSTHGSGGQVAYMPADIDRRYARSNLPDHGDLLANLILWTCKHQLPLEVDGPGLLDCHLYRQGERLILHVVNLTNPAAWRAPAESIFPVGPLRLRVRLADGSHPTEVRSLVSGRQQHLSTEAGWARFTADSIADHEVFVLE